MSKSELICIKKYYSDPRVEIYWYENGKMIKKEVLHN